MIKKILILSLVMTFLGISKTWAQQSKEDGDVLQEQPMSKQLLPYNNPMDIDTTEIDLPVTRDFKTVELDNIQKEILHRIADIYRIHVLALDAQVNNDPLSAENYINKALESIQKLMDDYPEIQNKSRFTELYRTVMTEYREFYGIDEPTDKVKGDIFAIRDEIFSEDDDLNVSNYNLPSNITTTKTDVPLIRNRQVNRHLIYMAMKHPDIMEQWLKRSEKYFPMMRKIFDEVGVPEELIHMAMIESGLVPYARSRAAAVGMWQFIRATGSMYGLEVNWWIDERRDPEKATRAAARHLKDLYNIWGDWHLVMAKYNVSSWRLKRAIRLGGGEKNYWSAYPYLPRETRGYVPSFIATTIISMHPEAFGFKKDYGIQPYRYDVAKVAGLMPLDKLAQAAGISTKKLKELNPELLRWATPPGSEYPLKIPKGDKQQFIAAYEKIPKDKRSNNLAIHVVKRGETLGGIAHRFGTSVRGLFEANKNLSSMIYPGQKIVVPLPSGGNTDIAAHRPSKQPRAHVSSRRSRSKPKAPANSAKLSYTVKSGDTIGHIAEWYDTEAWRIRSWNGIGNLIHVGQHLTVYVPKSKVSYYSQINKLAFSEKQQIEKEQRQGKKVTLQRFASNDDSKTLTYTVRRNDTLIDIANSFNVSVGAIKRINNLNGSRIYVGQKLTIKAPE